MKIRISFTPDEERAADSLLSKIKTMLPHVRVKRSDNNPQCSIMYISAARREDKESH